MAFNNKKNDQLSKGDNSLNI